jgi:hypothetical protein
MTRDWSGFVNWEAQIAGHCTVRWLDSVSAGSLVFHQTKKEREHCSPLSANFYKELRICVRSAATSDSGAGV